jgi:hypothetical protein
MVNPSATLFSLVYQEWEDAQECADTAWSEIWHQVRRYEAAQGRPPSEQQIAQAVRLEGVAHEWLAVVRHQLERAREYVPIL